jgi:hypothetical protein
VREHMTVGWTKACTQRSLRSLRKLVWSRREYAIILAHAVGTARARNFAHA